MQGPLTHPVTAARRGSADTAATVCTQLACNKTSLIIKLRGVINHCSLESCFPPSVASETLPAARMLWLTNGLLVLVFPKVFAKHFHLDCWEEVTLSHRFRGCLSDVTSML